MDTVPAKITPQYLCQLLNLPEPAMRPTMHALREAGLTPVPGSKQLDQPPLYNTFEALILYIKVAKQPLPPAARDFVVATLRVLQEPNLLQEVKTTPDAPSPKKSPPRKRAKTSKNLREQAAEQGLVTTPEIAQRFGLADSDYAKRESLKAKLRRWGLSPADEAARAYYAADVDTLAAKHGLEPQTDWPDWVETT